MTRPLTIVVGGYIVAFPLGGMTWHHLNYLLGLHELGHEVFFLEDSSDWAMPYDPRTWKYDADPAYGLKYLEHTLDRYGFPKDRFCYYSGYLDRHFGMNREQLDAVLARADLQIFVSGVTPLRPERPRPAKSLVIDTDPVFTQLRMRHDENFLNYYRQFDAVATFGKLIGTPSCPLPTHGFNWIGTNQPVSLQHWPVKPAETRRFTTIGKWEHASERNMEFNGQRFLSSKGVEWIKLLNLPEQAKWELVLAMQSMPGDMVDVFQTHGWKVEDPEKATESAESFQNYIRNSAGEFTVAKQIYSGLPSGWFSDRAACYLASGRPVITQRSGFEHWLPVGEGLLMFDDLPDAARALDAVYQDYDRHSLAARRIAEEHFDSRKVLNDLIGRVM